MTRYSYVDSPIGQILVTGDERGLSSLYFVQGKHLVTPPIDAERDDAAFAQVREELGEYFAGDRQEFTVSLNPVGTPFQLQVWQALRDIPYGVTASYGEQARRIGNPAAVRAVGLANGKNPISIIVPCHRVIGANGSLTGYGGGLENKRWLLDHEMARALF